jgi:hypothetical protein
MSSSNTPLWNGALWNSALFGGSGVPAGFTPAQVGQGLLYPALRKAQVTLGPQRTPSPAQFQDAIEELNRLVGSLNCDRLNIYTIQAYTFPLDPPKKTYTIGIPDASSLPADFDAPRPIAIESANILVSPSLRHPLRLFTDLQWATIQLQDIPNIWPDALYNDRAYPLSTLYFWGQPAAGCQLELYNWFAIPTFQTINDAVLLPPGYEDALVLNLAVRLAPHFQVPAVPPDVRADAQKALMRLESINAPRPIASVGFGCGRGYDIFSDR